MAVPRSASSDLLTFHQTVPICSSMARKKLPPNERLRAWRADKGLRQAEVADMFGVTTSAVCDWEKGTRIPRLPTLLRMHREGIIEIEAWA